jgi:hypothetical protein
LTTRSIYGRYTKAKVVDKRRRRVLGIHLRYNSEPKIKGRIATVNAFLDGDAHFNPIVSSICSMVLMGKKSEEDSSWYGTNLYFR